MNGELFMSSGGGYDVWLGDPQVPLQEAIAAAVDKALRDPALLAAALVRLPQEIRDQVRVLLDALESGSPRP